MQPGAQAKLTINQRETREWVGKEVFRAVSQDWNRRDGRKW